MIFAVAFVTEIEDTPEVAVELIQAIRRRPEVLQHSFQAALAEQGVEVSGGGFEIVEVTDPTVDHRSVQRAAGPWGECRPAAATAPCLEGAEGQQVREVWCGSADGNSMHLPEFLCFSLPPRAEQRACLQECQTTSYYEEEDGLMYVGIASAAGLLVLFGGLTGATVIRHRHRMHVELACVPDEPSIGHIPWMDLPPSPLSGTASNNMQAPEVVEAGGLEVIVAEEVDEVVEGGALDIRVDDQEARAFQMQVTAACPQRHWVTVLNSADV